MDSNNENALDFSPTKVLWKIHHDLIANTKESISIYRFIKSIIPDHIRVYVDNILIRFELINNSLDDFVSFYRENNISSFAHQDILSSNIISILSLGVIENLQSVIGSQIYIIKTLSNQIIINTILDDSVLTLLSKGDQNIDNITQIILFLQNWYSINNKTYKDLSAEH